MGRRSTFDEAEIYAAVGAAFACKGDARIQEIVSETGVSIGSIYYRFGSREGLLASAWFDALNAFHAIFLAALETDSVNAGENAALATPRFCRAERYRAIILACCRKSEFISPDSPTALQKQIALANNKIQAAIKRFAKQNGYSLLSCRLGMIAFPLAAVRMYLPENPVPLVIDDYVRAAYRSAINLDSESDFTVDRQNF